MSIDKASIEEKLKKLAETIAILEEYKKVSEKDFVNDYTINGAARHYLVLSIEIIIDAGNHILSESFQTKTERYGEIIEKLGELKIVDNKFIEKNINMTGFRNLLVHDYIKVDMKKVYDYLQKAPDVFRKFAKSYQEFLDKI